MSKAYDVKDGSDTAGTASTEDQPSRDQLLSEIAEEDTISMISEKPQKAKQRQLSGLK